MLQNYTILFAITEEHGSSFPLQIFASSLCSTEIVCGMAAHASEGMVGLKQFETRLCDQHFLNRLPDIKRKVSICFYMPLIHFNGPDPECSENHVQCELLTLASLLLNTTQQSDRIGGTNYVP